MIEQQQLSIINHLVKEVNNSKTASSPSPPVPRPRSITPNIIENLPIMKMSESQSTIQTPEPISNFKQQTWKEREEEELQHLENEERLTDFNDGKVLL